MADIQQTVELIFRGQNQTNAAIAGIQRDLAALSGNADTSTRALNGTNDQLERIGSNRAGIASATVALQALAGSLVIKDFIDANVAVEQFRNTLKLVTGSTEGANRELDFITTTANRLGVEVRGAAGAYASFAAAAKGTAAEGEGSRVVFEGFATAFAALGTSSADVTGAFTQLAQGVSKGRFELDDLKSVAERLPGFFNTFAGALGVTNKEFFELISKGNIGIPELIKVAEQLKTQFGSADFSSFNNELARLRNEITKTQTLLGDSGAFNVLTGGVRTGGLAVGTLAAGFDYLSGTTSAFYKFIKGDSSLDQLERDLQNVELRAIDASDALTGQLNQSLAETNRLSRQALEAANKIVPDQTTAETARLLRQNSQAVLDEIQNSVKTLNSLKDINVFGENLTKAFLEGKLTASDFEKAVVSLGKKQGELGLQSQKTSKELENTTKNAQDYAAKLQSIASNERIKVIESRVKLEIAQAVANAQKFESALESLSATVESSGDVISSIFGAFGDIEGFFGLEKLELVQEQLEIENKIRQEALDLQRQLIESQINLNQSRTASLQRGNALIQIDGKGLQPHLEAFMWEILKTIQTRVNADGLELLVGT
jgi:tape measure domain-containing protein